MSDLSPAQNELYADFIVKYMGNFNEDLGDVPGLSFQKINSCLLYTSPVCVNKSGRSPIVNFQVICTK